MLHVRPSNTRGYAHHGWLESFNSFSFASYYDPDNMGYSVLRVINDDKIAPAAGFGMHGHQDMEIITYMLEGELAVRLKNGAVKRLKAGDALTETVNTLHNGHNVGAGPVKLIVFYAGVVNTPLTVMKADGQ